MCKSPSLFLIRVQRYSISIIFLLGQEQCKPFDFVSLTFHCHARVTNPGPWAWEAVVWLIEWSLYFFYLFFCIWLVIGNPINKLRLLRSIIERYNISNLVRIICLYVGIMPFQFTVLSNLEKWYIFQQFLKMSKFKILTNTYMKKC